MKAIIRASYDDGATLPFTRQDIYNLKVCLMIQLADYMRSRDEQSPRFQELWSLFEKLCVMERMG